MNKLPILITFILFILLGGVFLSLDLPQHGVEDFSLIQENPVDEGGEITTENPLSIEYMRKQEYPGSEITIEQNLDPGNNYQRFIASYKSEGLKIFGLLTVPHGNPPNSG